MRVAKWPVVGVVLAVVWLLVRGVALEPVAVAGESLIGLVVGLGLAYGFRRMYLPEVNLARSLRATPAALYYVGVFLWELATANVDVAYRVLAPSMPIEPAVVAIPLRVETDAAITSLANSITLTPGTLTMDHDPEINTLYVHGITGRRREQTVAPIRRWEDLLLVVFEEEADPGDDPPPVPREPGATAEAGEPGGPGETAEPGATGTADEASRTIETDDAGTAPGSNDSGEPVEPDDSGEPVESSDSGGPIERDRGESDGR